MILMLAPAPNMSFGSAPSGATYVSDQYALVRVTNNSAADQTALQNAGCSTLTPFAGWSSGAIDTLADLYAADGVVGLVLSGQTGFSRFTLMDVYNDGPNTGTWAKTSSGIGAGNWTQISPNTAVGTAVAARSAVAAETTRATNAEQALAGEITTISQSVTGLTSTTTASAKQIAANGNAIAVFAPLVTAALNTVGIAVPYAANGANGPFTIQIGAAPTAANLYSVTAMVEAAGSGDLAIVILTPGANGHFTATIVAQLAAVTATGLLTWSSGADFAPIALAAGQIVALASAAGGVTLSYDPNQAGSYVFTQGKPAQGGDVTFGTGNATFQANFVYGTKALSVPRSAINPVDAANLAVVAAHTNEIVGLDAMFGPVTTTYAGAPLRVVGGQINNALVVIGSAGGGETTSALHASIAATGAAQLVILRAGAIASVWPLNFSSVGADVQPDAMPAVTLQAADLICLNFPASGAQGTNTSGVGGQYAQNVNPAVGQQIGLSTAAIAWRAYVTTTRTGAAVGASALDAPTSAAVQRVQADAARDASAVRVPLSGVLPAFRGWNGLPYYGESLSTGVMPNAVAIVSATQPNFNQTFGSGPKSGKPGNTYGAINTSPGTSTVKALVEDTATGADNNGQQGETMCSGAANGAVEYAAAYLNIATALMIIFASTAGHGGDHWSDLSKGQPWYNNLLDHVSEAAKRAVAAGVSYAVPAVVLVLGHNDAAAHNANGDSQAVSRAAYLAATLQFVSDINNDLPALINGIMNAAGLPTQNWPVHVLMSQLSTLTATNGGRGVALAQLDAVQRSPLIHLTGPKYQHPYCGDGVHLMALGYQAQGHIDGRAYAQLLVSGRVPDAILPRGAVIQGTTLTLRFSVPRAPLVLDPNTIGLATQFGFRLFDSNGEIALSSIVATGDKVTATLSRATTNSAAPTISYALNDLGVDTYRPNSASGNLRDSTPETYSEGGVPIPLWHWCPHFQTLVSVIAEA